MVAVVRVIAGHVVAAADEIPGWWWPVLPGRDSGDGVPQPHGGAFAGVEQVALRGWPDPRADGRMSTELLRW